MPAGLAQHLAALVVVPPDTPAPTSMLQNLWQVVSLVPVMSTGRGCFRTLHRKGGSGQRPRAH